MGSLSFGISELMNESAAGWFKLLNQVLKSPYRSNLALPIQEEGEFYNINIPPEYEDEVEKVRNKMEDNHVSLSSNVIFDNCGHFQVGEAARAAAKEKVEKKDALKSAAAELAQRDVIKASDFNFLTVLGKGSFGKVS